MKNYDEFDTLLKNHIGHLNERKITAHNSRLVVLMENSLRGGEMFDYFQKQTKGGVYRAVDRRLQTLRKKGVVEYKKATTGWTLK